MPLMRMGDEAGREMMGVRHPNSVDASERLNFMPSIVWRFLQYFLKIYYASDKREMVNAYFGVSGLLLAYLNQLDLQSYLFLCLGWMIARMLSRLSKLGPLFWLLVVSSIALCSLARIVSHSGDLSLSSTIIVNGLQFTLASLTACCRSKGTQAKDQLTAKL